MNGPDSASTKRKYAPRLPLEERREHLLDAALHVLARDGYENVSVEAIAQAAGVSRPVVYSAYDGLEPLLLALLDRTQQRAADSALTLLGDHPEPGRAGVWVVALVGRLLDVVRAEPDVWRPVLGLTRNAPSVVRDRIEETRSRLGVAIATVLQGDIDRHGLDLDAEVLARLLMVSAEELARLVLEEPERFPKERLMATLRGLVPPEVLQG